VREASAALRDAWHNAREQAAGAAAAAEQLELLALWVEGKLKEAHGGVAASLRALSILSAGEARVPLLFVVTPAVRRGERSQPTRSQPTSPASLALPYMEAADGRVDSAIPEAILEAAPEGDACMAQTAPSTDGASPSRRSRGGRRSSGGARGLFGVVSQLESLAPAPRISHASPSPSPKQTLAFSSHATTL
jgi:hypothetical protein